VMRWAGDAVGSGEKSEIQAKNACRCRFSVPIPGTPRVWCRKQQPHALTAIAEDIPGNLGFGNTRAKNVWSVADGRGQMRRREPSLQVKRIRRPSRGRLCGVELNTMRSGGVGICASAAANCTPSPA